MSVTDESKDYRPVSKIIMDIPTGLNFFGQPQIALQKIGATVRKMMDAWNAKYQGKTEVIIKIVEFILQQIPNKQTYRYHIVIACSRYSLSGPSRFSLKYSGNTVNKHNVLM